jgi:hypothetical protein
MPADAGAMTGEVRHKRQDGGAIILREYLSAHIKTFFNFRYNFCD